MCHWLELLPLFLEDLFEKYSKKVQDQVAESQVVVEETMQGISIVKAFANEWYEIARYKEKNKGSSENGD